MNDSVVFKWLGRGLWLLAVVFAAIALALHGAVVHGEGDLAWDQGLSSVAAYHPGAACDTMPLACDALADIPVVESKIQAAHDREVVLIVLALLSAAAAIVTFVYRRAHQRKRVCASCRKHIHAAATVCPYCQRLQSVQASWPQNGG